MKRPSTQLTLKILNRYQAKLNKQDLETAREYFDRITSVRLKTKIGDVLDVSLPGMGHKITARIYKPKQDSLSTIVYFHGGGWVLGSLDSHDEVARLLCKVTGCNVVSVGYRLAPEYHYPAQSEDGLEVIKSLINKKLKLPANRVFLAGDSAGGQIALAVTLRADEASKQRICGLILIYPALDPSLKSKSMNKLAEGHFVTKKNMEQFWKQYLGTSSYRWPLSGKDLLRLPPTLIQTAQYDILRDEAHELAEQLRDAGNKIVYHNYAASTHGMMQLPSLLSARRNALRDIRDFIKKS